MAKHQIIYTSCKKGIEGGNDGQQVYSYDEGFEGYKNLGVNNLFGYVVPTKPGQSMTEELALTMPKAFAYRTLKNGIVAISLNTYLGRDYMGSTGRFGNTLSHVITLEESELDCYPCELYQGPALRSSMRFEEVNSDERPDYLPEPVFHKGDLINPDQITDFLEDDRMQYFRQMVAQILRYDSEKKRIVICDEQENVVKWFAAVHYAFPIEIAAKIFFSSFVYDPSLADTPLCGVVSEGSKYAVGQYRNNNRFHLYDFFSNDLEEEVTQQDNFLDFLENAISYNYDRLVEFRDFVSRKTTFREVSEEYYDAYQFFNLFDRGLSEFGFEEFQSVTAFSDRYATRECKTEIVRKMLNREDTFTALGNNYQYIFAVLTYMLKSYVFLDDETKHEMKDCLISRLMFALSDQDLENEEFCSLYEQLRKIALGIGLSIPSELMENSNRDTLLNLMKQGIATWKTVFILQTITDYVVDQKMPHQDILPEKPMGKLQSGILDALMQEVPLEAEELEQTVSQLLEFYPGHIIHLFYFTVMIEKSLKRQNRTLDWTLFAQKTVGADVNSLLYINTVLCNGNRLEELFTIYQARMQNQKSYKVCASIFAETRDEFFSKNKKYAGEYIDKAVNELIEMFLILQKQMEDEERRKNALKLLDILAEERIYFTENTGKVCKLMEQYYDYLNQDKEQDIVLEKIRDYYDASGEEYEGKLALAVIEKELADVKETELSETITYLANAVKCDSADIMKIQETDLRADYYYNIYQNLLEYPLAETDFCRIHSLFDLSGERKKDYYINVTKLVIKKTKKDMDNLVAYLCSTLDISEKSVLEEIGKCLCKVGDKRLDEIDDEMRRCLKKDKEDLKTWALIHKAAEETNPLLKGISDLFHRNK